MSNKKCLTQEQLDAALHSAVVSNDVSSIAMCICDGADINSPNSDDIEFFNHSPAWIAARCGCVESLGMLIEAGAQLDSENAGETLLTAVVDALFGDEARGSAILRMLIYAGVNVDAADDADWTALMSAARWGRLDMVKILIKAGANVNRVQCGDGLTALHVASKHGHVGVLDALLSAGADASNPEVQQGRIAEQYTEHPEVKDYFLARRQFRHNFKLNKPSGMELERLNTALFFAALENKPDHIQRIIDDGAEINSVCGDEIGEEYIGECAISIAAMFRSDKALEKLIELKADFVLASGEMLLIKSIRGCSEKPQGGTLAAVNKLMAAGLDIYCCHEGYSALHAAADAGDVEIIEFLVIEKGFDANAQTDYGATPLHFAVQFSHRKAIEALLNLGADLSLRNSELETPKDIGTEESILCINAWLAGAAIRGVLKAARLART